LVYETLEWKLTNASVETPEYYKLLFGNLNINSTNFASTFFFKITAMFGKTSYTSLK